jgi:hypothetical protein
MNVFLEPLPGLLDDPQFQISDLPHLTDYHIAPLRDPAPSRSIYAPLPLEPTAGNSLHTRTTPTTKHVPEKRKTPKISPAEILHARDTKKPSLSISELVEAHTAKEAHQFQLPSFISLAIVEKSPVQQAQSIHGLRSHKRPRLDYEDISANDEYRHLPLPSQNDGKHVGRTKPLLPAMVTGLHEPPPTAALLPSMATEKMLSRSPKKDSRLQVEPSGSLNARRGQGRPPERMVNSPEITAMPVVSKVKTFAVPIEQEAKDTKPTEPKQKDTSSKSRRAPKRWTEEETDQLMRGVRKHGIGKWKQILADPELQFDRRSSVDLKDRFRVRMPDAYRDREMAAGDNNAMQSSFEPDQTNDLTRDSSSTTTAKDNSQPNPQVYPTTAIPTAEEAPRPAAAPKTPILTSQENAAPSPIPLSKNQRRKRRPWTTVEDNDLMRGVQRHGFQWTMIHDDPTLNLSHRKATDLRDRIRNMFPDGYKNAGTRSSSKKEQAEGSRTLPPLVLDDDGDWDWSNNTLPPLLEWEEIGM